MLNPWIVSVGFLGASSELQLKRQLCPSGGLSRCPFSCPSIVILSVGAGRTIILFSVQLDDHF